MTFLTDTTWPAYLLELFEAFTKDPPLENRYEGLYFRLFLYCLGKDFFITQQFIPIKHPPSGTADFAPFLVVVDSRGRGPLLIIQIKENNWLTTAKLRFKADKQMRLGYDTILSDCPIPRLWGLSLLGTSLRIYCGDPTGDVEPVLTEHSNPSGTLPQNFLEGEWNVDILSQQGFDRVKEIVKDVADSVKAALQ